MKTPCRHPGCPNLARARFCEDHAKDNKRPAEHRRGTAAERGYDHHWIRIAEQRRELDSYLCQPCLEQGRLEEARTVDHIIPVQIRPDWRLEIGNTQVICDACHKQKTHQDNLRYGSSTATRLTTQQLESRALVQRLTDTPRGAAD
jgi:5-methylcytosine-specific restriction protein A